MSLSEDQLTHLYLEMQRVLYSGDYLRDLGALHDRFIGLSAADLNWFAIAAARLGDEKIIELFRMTRTKVPPMRRETETALHVAAHYGPAIVKSDLINALFDLYTFRNYVDEGGLTHFHAACLAGNRQMMGFYWNYGDVDLNATFKYGPAREDKTALHLAANALQDDAIEWLVSRGASLEMRDSAGRTPLSQLCHKLGCYDERPETPARYQRTLDKLLHLGAQVNTIDDHGNSPLLNLFSRGVLVNAHYELQIDCFRQLVIHGADVTFKDHLGSNMYHYIALNTARFFEHDGQSKARVEWVMQRLFAVLGSNATDQGGNTPLSLAVAKVNSPLVRMFLGNRGAPADAYEDTDEIANGHADSDTDEDAADERARAVLNTINLQQGCFAPDYPKIRDLAKIDNCLRIVRQLNAVPSWGWTLARKQAILRFLEGPREPSHGAALSDVLCYGSYDVIQNYLRSFIMSPDYVFRNPFLHQCIFDIWKFVTIIDIGDLYKHRDLHDLLEETTQYLKSKLPESEREKDLFNRPKTVMRIQWQFMFIQHILLRDKRSILEFCQTDLKDTPATWHFREGVARIVPCNFGEIAGVVHGLVAKSICYQLFDEDEENGIFAEDNL